MKLSIVFAWFILLAGRVEADGGAAFELSVKVGAGGQADWVGAGGRVDWVGACRRADGVAAFAVPGGSVAGGGAAFELSGNGGGCAQDFDRSAFYGVMATGSLEGVNHELALVRASAIMEKEAYEGALLMRKAGLVAIPAEKLKFFKSGRIKLESAILNDSTNGEYHFLRLTVQEHAPRIVKYAGDLERDSQYIHQTFKSLSPVVQQAIIDYSIHSKILRREDFAPKNA
jgi:hypothetical protein